MFDYTYRELIKTIKDQNICDGLMCSYFGMEKENVRVNQVGELSTSPHPNVFGDKLKNPYIITDFSESQVEMITPKFDSAKKCFDFLENLHHIVVNEIGDELLWPQSMPPIIPSDEEIPIAKYNDSIEGRVAEKYRERLAEKYGAKKQLISGIHYNFSFKDEFLKKVYEGLGIKSDFKYFKSDIYLRIARNFIKYGWVLNYLMGSSVAVDKSYTDDCINELERLNDDTYYLPYATSIRNSHLGYKNPENFLLSYNSIDDYISEIEELIEKGDIQSAAEYYSPIRLKSKDNKAVLNNLRQYGVEYVEIRSIDLNPEKPIGIDLKDVKFIHLFLLFMLINMCDCFSKDLHQIALENWDLVAVNGRREGKTIYSHAQNQMAVNEIVLMILDGMLELIEVMEVKDHEYYEVVKAYRTSAENKQLYSETILNHIKNKSYINYHLDRARTYKADSFDKRFNLIGYESLELSTQILIKDAMKRGLITTIIDPIDNFITIENKVKKEYIKQATKTSLDSYITFLMMENKVVTKLALKEKGIKVPVGADYSSKEEALKAYDIYKDHKIVIKPKSTNFGIGITIFKGKYSKEDYIQGVEFAFSKDSTVLIEEFIEGLEYRFFVINDEVVGILHRVPANVQGDGKQTIRELVEEKNKDSLRGEGYRKPLEKLKLAHVEKQFLKAQGLTFDSIIECGKIVYLRENSNVSTGGDSIDFTDDIGQDYKAIAIKAAKAVNAKICGVDMMIKDINHPCNNETYGIIEVNFNPAIHIHCYPYKGRNRKLGKKILDALDF